MFLAIIFIIIITISAALLNRIWRWKICPICAGVSGSWLILTAGIVFGNWSGDYKLPIAMLMGGTVVGIAFQGEAKFTWAKGNIWFWKTPVVILGIPVAYWLLQNMSLETFAVEIILLAFLNYIFFFKFTRGGGRKNNRHADELEEKMKNCC